MEVDPPFIILGCLLLIPLLMACGSLCFYRKRLVRMLPDFWGTEPATSKERYQFKVQSEEQLRQAALAEAGVLKPQNQLGGAPSRSLTLRPDEVPQDDHMESLVLDGDQVVEMRQASKTSCSTVPNGSHSSGENEDRTLARAGSNSSVGMQRAGSKSSVGGAKRPPKVSRSLSKQSRTGSKTSSSRPEPQLQRGRSLSEGQLISGKSRTLGEELAFRNLARKWQVLFLKTCFIIFMWVFRKNRSNHFKRYDIIIYNPEN